MSNGATEKTREHSEIKAAMERLDSWTNALTSMGVAGKDPRMASHFVRRDHEISQPEIEAMYESDALFARVVDVVPEHAVRRWIDIKASMDQDGTPDEELGRVLMDALDEMKAQEACYQALRYERMSAGSAIVLGAEDHLPVSAPLNLKRVEELKTLNVVDRWDLWPDGVRNRDPFSPWFRTFEHYRFSAATDSEGRAGVVTPVHRSRLIVFEGIVANDRVRDSRRGFGVSVVERVYEPLRRFYSLLNYAEAAFKDVVQGVLTIPSLALQIAENSQEAANNIAKRLKNLALAASAFNAIVISEGETYERRTLSLAGFSDMLLREMDELCAAAEMPLSILFGQAPTGLSTDDVGGRTTFYDSIANQQRRKLRDPIRRILEVLCAAKYGPTGGKIPATIQVVFRPLTEPTDKEIAEINASKMTTAVAGVNGGILAADEVRRSLARDPTFPIEIDLSLEMSDVQPPGENEGQDPSGGGPGPQGGGDAEDEEPGEEETEEEDAPAPAGGPPKAPVSPPPARERIQLPAARSRRDSRFEENQHPRAQDGRFGDKAGDRAPEPAGGSKREAKPKSKTKRAKPGAEDSTKPKPAAPHHEALHGLLGRATKSPDGFLDLPAPATPKERAVMEALEGHIYDQHDEIKRPGSAPKAKRREFAAKHKIMTEIANAPVKGEAPEIFRGITLAGAQVENLRAGAVADLGDYTSWTRDRDVGAQFADTAHREASRDEEREDLVPVLLHIKTPKFGTDLSAIRIKNKGYEHLDEREFLTGGDVIAKSVRDHEIKSSVDGKPKMVHVVEMEHAPRGGRKDSWEENAHPRAQDGRFGDKAGETGQDPDLSAGVVGIEDEPAAPATKAKSGKPKPNISTWSGQEPLVAYVPKMSAEAQTRYREAALQAHEDLRAGTGSIDRLRDLETEHHAPWYGQGPHGRANYGSEHPTEGGHGTQGERELQRFHPRHVVQLTPETTTQHPGGVIGYSDKGSGGDDHLIGPEPARREVMRRQTEQNFNTLVARKPELADLRDFAAAHGAQDFSVLPDLSPSDKIAFAKAFGHKDRKYRDLREKRVQAEAAIEAARTKFGTAASGAEKAAAKQEYRAAKRLRNQIVERKNERLATLIDTMGERIGDAWERAESRTGSVLEHEDLGAFFHDHLQSAEPGTAIYVKGLNGVQEPVVVASNHRA